jgi:hypothetical protein
MQYWRNVIAALVLVLGLMTPTTTPLPVNASAGPRPLADFLSAQGTYCLDLDGPPPSCDLFVPPSPNMIGWAAPPPTYGVFALLDYAGLANNYLVSQGGTSLGTTITGSINERPLADGRAEVSVTLHTKKALVLVSDISATFPGPLLLGHRVDEVLAGATPALANSTFRVVFINTAPGAPLPDLIQLSFAPLPGQEFRFLSIHARGTGPFPDGSPGEVVIVQTGIFVTTSGGATADGFPAERIDLHPIGK